MTEAETTKSKLYVVISETFEAKMRTILKDKATPESVELLLTKHPNSALYKHEPMNESFDLFLTGVEIGVSLQGK